MCRARGCDRAPAVEWCSRHAEERDKACVGKQPYPSKLTATNAAVLHGWAGRGGMAPYLCQFCPGEVWHLGHPGRRPQANELLAEVAAAEARVLSG